MSIELIRLKVFHPSAAPLKIAGSVVVRSDGIADFFADAADNAETISRLLEQMNVEPPFARVRPEDLDLVGQTALRADALCIGGERLIGPLLLRPHAPPTIGGAIDAAAAAIIHRVLGSFTAVRAAGGLRRAA